MSLEIARDNALLALAELGEAAYYELRMNAGRMGYNNIMRLQNINQVTTNCIGNIAGLPLPEYADAEETPEAT